MCDKNFENVQMDELMLDLDNAERINNVYNNPTCKVLISACKIVGLPIGIIDDAVKKFLSERTNKKLETVCKYIVETNKVIDCKLLNENETFSKMLLFFRAIEKTETLEKIKFLTCFMLNGINNELSINIYEEYLENLSSLTLRQMIVLCEVYDFEEGTSNTPDIQKWESFTKELSNKIKMNVKELQSILLQIASKGYLIEIPCYYNYGETDCKIYEISDYFKLMREYLIMN